MTTATARTRPAAARRPLKSPLAAPTWEGTTPHLPSLGGERPARRQALSEREQTLEEFADYLRTTTNRDGRPYEEATINAYVSPTKHLDAWMTGSGIDGDFTAADTLFIGSPWLPPALNPAAPRNRSRPLALPESATDPGRGSLRSRRASGPRAIRTPDSMNYRWRSNIQTSNRR